MRHMLALLALLLTGAPALAQDRTLDRLAEDADLIAIVRVADVDYVKTRGFPSKGSAYLRVLIAYRGTEAGAMVEVEEEGLEEAACYYPEVGAFDLEGDRFLVFLRATDKKDVYRGRRPGCAIPVLVTESSAYALRMPVEGLEVPASAIEEVAYSDPAAFIDIDDLTFAEARRLEDAGIVARFQSRDPLAPDPGLLIYRLGVPIAGLRALMFPPAGQDTAAQ